MLSAPSIRLARRCPHAALPMKFLRLPLCRFTPASGHEARALEPHAPVFPRAPDHVRHRVDGAGKSRLAARERHHLAQRMRLQLITRVLAKKDRARDELA